MKRNTLIKLAFLAALTGLIVSCWNPSVLGVDPDDIQELPEGTTLVNIHLGSGGGRTLLPADPVFARYSLSFSHEQGNTHDPVVNITGEELVAGVTVPLSGGGLWTITAVGYVDLSGVTGMDTSPDAEQGMLPGLYPAAKSSVMVDLTPQWPYQDVPYVRDVAITINAISETGEGILDYDITLPGYTSTAMLSVLNLQGNALIPPISINLMGAGNNAGSRAIPSGYHILQVSVAGHGDDAAVKRTILHIYSGLRTSAIMTDDFNIIKNAIVDDPAAYDLTGLITPPAADAVAQTQLHNEWFSGAITWRESDRTTGTLLTGNLFGWNRQYTATINITANEGISFGDVAADAFTSTDPGMTVSNAAGSFTVSVVFQDATAIPDRIVYAVDNVSGTNVFRGTATYTDGDSVIVPAGTLTANTAPVDLNSLGIVNFPTANSSEVALDSRLGGFFYGNGDWSMELIVKNTATSTANRDVVVFSPNSRTGNAEANQAGSFFIRAAGTATVPTWTYTTNPASTGQFSVTPAAALGTWGQLIIVKSGSTLTVYRNGEQQNTSAGYTGFANAAFNNIAFARIGRFTGASSQVFRFSLQPRALTAAEVSAEYTAQSANLAILNQQEQPVITVQPVGGTYTLFSSNALTIAAAPLNDGGTLSYRWYEVDPVWGDDTIAGTGASFLPAVSGSYYAMAVNTRGVTELATRSETVAVTTIMPDLPLIYRVPSEPSAGTGTVAFRGTFASGETVNAVIANGTSTAAANVIAVQRAWLPGATSNTTAGRPWVLRTGNSTTAAQNGWIALGDVPGVLLKNLPEWSIEVYVHIPTGSAIDSDARMIWGMAHDNIITSGAAGGPSMWLFPNVIQLKHATTGWGGISTQTIATPANPGGNAMRGRWRHLMVANDGTALSVYMDGSLVSRHAQANLNTSLGTHAQFIYAYLGRSIFHGNGDAQLRNSQYYQFGIYDEALDQEKILALGIADTLFLLNQNNPPVTSVALSTIPGVSAGLTSGSAVGTLAAGGGIGPYTYALVAGTGSTNNGEFTIVGSELRVGASTLTHGRKSIRVTATDVNNQSFTQAITLSIPRVSVPYSLRYDFNSEGIRNRTGSTGGVTVEDETGLHTGTLMTTSASTTTQVNGRYVLTLAGTTASCFFNLGATAGNILFENNAMTVSVVAWVPTGSAPTYNAAAWLWGLSATNGAAESNTAVRIYHQFTNSTNQEINVSGGSNRRWHYWGPAFPRGNWTTVVFTLSGTVGVAYINGSETSYVSNNDNVANWSNRNLQYNYLGRNTLSSTGYLRNGVRYADFRIYNRALEGDEMATLFAELNAIRSQLNGN
ncbi:MAG: LamG domain-containing protein [Treponema sp.]|nr:LamG domain-containing protein [Treponema sp.]